MNRTARIRRNREAHPSDIPCHESKLYKPYTEAPIYNAPRNDCDSNRKFESPGVHRRDRPLYFRRGKVACWQRRRCTIGPPSTPVLAPQDCQRLLAKILSREKILSAVISHDQKSVLLTFVITSSNFKHICHVRNRPNYLTFHLYRIRRTSVYRKMGPFRLDKRSSYFTKLRI